MNGVTPGFRKAPPIAGNFGFSPADLKQNFKLSRSSMATQGRPFTPIDDAINIRQGNRLKGLAALEREKEGHLRGHLLPKLDDRRFGRMERQEITL